ncbi:MAG: SpaA isopeptide-forming pilin-related protein, partial [Clostridium sp.]
IRSTSNFNGVKNLSIKANLGNPTALVYNGKGAYQDILKFSWGDLVEKFAAVNVKFTALGTINLHKTNDKGLNLQGVKFGLYSDGAATNLIKESTTDSNGNITFSDLNEGTYYVKELATLEGHILSNEIKEVKVIAGQTNQFDWINETIKSKVKFYKYDEDTQKPMPNVEFKIEALSGLDQGKNWSIVTDETGYFEQELAYGQYQITEVKTLEGYILNNEPIKFEVKENGQVIELSMSNKRIKSEVKLLKLDSETGLPMPNVKFTIKAINGLEQGQAWEVVTDESGYISMELPYGDYEITEVETLEGYILNSTPIKFSVTQDGQVIELSMQNDRVKGNAELLKVYSETKEPLANVVFELECLEGFNQGSKVELVSDSTGIVKISDLQYGKYRLTEIKTIEGYVLDSTPIEFEIRNHGETINLVMENRKIKGKLEIVKIDGNSSKKLQGAEFGIYDKDKNLIEVITTDENGSATSSELNYGQYYYRELKSPDGYVVDGNYYEFNVEEDNIVQIIKFKNYPVITYKRTIETKKWNKTYNSTIPNTGDNMNVGMSLLALLASGGLIVATRRKRK